MQGCTVFCVASGPSLTEADCDLVRESGAPIIAVNTTWERFRNASVIFAADAIWWRKNAAKIDIDASRVSLSQNAERAYNAKQFKSKLHAMKSCNSGCAAIEYAIRREADQVVMVGYDCSLKHGIHWHGKHVGSGNPSRDMVNRWMKQFEALRNFYPDADVINCSRYTEIDCFPKHSLEEILGQI